MTFGNPFDFTARELEISRLVADGLNNTEIAERLSLSRQGVTFHLTGAMRKAEARNRTDLAVRLIRELEARP